MNIKRIISALLVLTTLFSCQKTKKKIIESGKDCEFENQECDSATFLLGNQTSFMIYFGLGSNFYEDSLAPKEVRAIKMGPVKVTYDKKNCERKRTSWTTWFVHSSVGDWAFDVDHCQKASNFRYNPDSSGVSLYDDTNY